MRSLIFIAAALLLSACSQDAAAPSAPEAGVAEQAAAVANTENDPAQTLPQTPAAPADALAGLAEPAPATPVPNQPVQQAAADERDARMVGIWVNENNINSGGGDFASYSTVMTMELYPDGRVLQYTESVGGGGDWSYDGGRTLDFDGQWRADGQTLYVYAAPLPDFTPVATYSFSSEYLVTQSDMGRLIWQRRG